MSQKEPNYIYVTTIGRKTGNPHQIEIWFVSHDGGYYIVSEGREQSDWVKNVMKNPAVTLRVGSRTADPIPATGRPVDAEQEPALAAAVSRLMDAKYGWSTGLIMEFKPTQ
jgi:deazaflavin-dependent oxidoreductase (nitroreductase family)